MTLITLSMPWPYVAIIFPASLFVFHILSQSVCAGMEMFETRDKYCSVKTAGIAWVFAIAVTAMVMSTAPAVERAMSVMFSLFLFQMAVTDALTGLLPREMTVSCLIAGLTAALLSSGLTEHLLSVAATLGIFSCWRFLSLYLYDRECLGLGDVWLAGGIGAWLGGKEGLYALLIGVVLFVLWQISVRRVAVGGPMGPWLCAGAISVTIFELYQPLITW